MKLFLNTVLALAVIGSSVYARSEVRSHSGAIVIEFPSDLPKTVRQTSDAMCLRSTSDGRTFLYIEQDKGSKLVILNVTEPESIHLAAVVPLAASAPFDFVQEVGASEELIRYRDDSSFALLDLRKYNHPVVKSTERIINAESIRSLGVNGLLLTSSNNTKPIAGSRRSYEVIDTQNGSALEVVAQIRGVSQVLEKPDTSTIFMLNNDGLTVIRQSDAEDANRIQLAMQDGR